MRRLIWPVLFLFLLMLQGAVTVFYTGWIDFDLPLLALYGYCMLRQEGSGLFAGLGIGLLQDALTPGIFGFHMLTRSCMGYLISITREKVFKDNPSYHMLAIGVFSLMLRFSLWWVELIRSGGLWSMFPHFVWDTIGYCVGNILLVVPVVRLVKKIYYCVREEDISY
ncbi:MAG: rod shape-determining protein MreD [Phascolarctobacterium sp.]|nr:rod shape-determining protein MreD [Phascolarctobacterium sp.]